MVKTVEEHLKRPQIMQRAYIFELSNDDDFHRDCQVDNSEFSISELHCILRSQLSSRKPRYATIKTEKCLKRPLIHSERILVLQLRQKDCNGDDYNDVEYNEDDACELDDSKFEHTRVVNIISRQAFGRPCIAHDSAITQLPSRHGCIYLQIQGRKDRLKQLIKATIFKDFGKMMGISEGKSKKSATKIIKLVFHGLVRFKKDGLPRKKALNDSEANKLLAEVEIMKSLCSDSEKILLPGMVEAVHHDVMKYWLRRYTLFSRFNEGIKLDEEGLFSVTPEEIAKKQAARCGSGTVVDAFTGVGGNAIQFALLNFNVIAIDIDCKKIEYARHNANVYGVADKIDFIIGDFFQLAPSLKADVVFLSPPWGGPEYIRMEKYDIETMLKPKDGFSLFRVSLSVAPSVAFFLPRTVDMEQLAELSWQTTPPLPYEIEKNFVHNELKAVTAYYGKIVDR